MTKLKMSAAILAAGLMTVAGSAVAQQQVAPKSGPDINQPKYVPGTAGAPTGNTGHSMDPSHGSGVTGGGGDGGSSSGTSGAGAAGSGGTGGSSGGGASGGGSGGAGGGSGSN
jgi:hypothetical protein